MFTLNDDLSIYATRGDVVFFTVSADDNGNPYYFQPGDIVRITVYGKKAAEKVFLRKDFPVTEESDIVLIYLDETDTRFGDIISKPVDYWYEIELNPDTLSQTLIGYDDDGAKVFRVLPEGKESGEYEPQPEDIPVVDTRLDLRSERPVANRAVAMAIAQLTAAIEELKAQMEGEK